MNTYEVSIVICTHRRSKLLENVVQSLIDQTANPDTYEVIVVDNDYIPNKEVEEIVQQAVQKIPIRYVHEHKIGLSHARNAGGMRVHAD